MCGNGPHANNPRVSEERRLQRVQGQPGHHDFQLASATLQNHVSKKTKKKPHTHTNKKTRTE